MTPYPLMPLFGEPLGPWCKWFAWRPVKLTDGGFVWFRWVARRRIEGHNNLSPHPGNWWQYATTDGRV